MYEIKNYLYLSMLFCLHSLKVKLWQGYTPVQRDILPLIHHSGLLLRLIFYLPEKYWEQREDYQYVFSPYVLDYRLLMLIISYPKDKLQAQNCATLEVDFAGRPDAKYSSICVYIFTSIPFTRTKTSDSLSSILNLMGRLSL